MGGTRLELMTSSVSGKRATNCANRPRWRRDSNPCARICSPLPRLSATPPVRTGLAAAGTRPTPSGRRDSNPRPSPWQGDALPTEPRPRATRACGLGAHATITTLRRGRQTEGRRGRPTPADVRAPCGFGYRWGPRAIGAVVARFVHTEEVTGSNPVSPTAILPSHSPIAPRNRVLVGNCTFAELSVCHAASRRHGISSRKRVTSFNLTRWAATAHVSGSVSAASNTGNRTSRTHPRLVPPQQDATLGKQIPVLRAAGIAWITSWSPPSNTSTRVFSNLRECRTRTGPHGAADHRRAACADACVLPGCQTHPNPQ